MPTPNGVNYLLQFLITFIQFPNCLRTRIKADASTYMFVCFLQAIGICGFKGSTLFLIYVVTHKGLSHIIKSSICFTKSADVKCGISEKS